MKKFLAALTIIAGVWSLPILSARAVTISANLPGVNASSASPGSFINGFYQFALIAGGILAFGVVVYGGIRYMTSAGNPSSQGEAKEWITAALLGMLLLAGAYYILKVVNPNLVNLSLPTLQSANTNTPTIVSGQSGPCGSGSYDSFCTCAAGQTKQTGAQNSYGQPSYSCVATTASTPPPPNCGSQSFDATCVCVPPLQKKQYQYSVGSQVHNYFKCQ